MTSFYFTLIAWDAAEGCGLRFMWQKLTPLQKIFLVILVYRKFSLWFWYTENFPCDFGIQKIFLVILIYRKFSLWFWYTENFPCDFGIQKIFLVILVYRKFSLWFWYTENFPCDFGIQYTKDKNRYTNANFSTKSLNQRTQRAKGFWDVLVFTIYNANSTLTAHTQSFGCGRMTGVVMLWMCLLIGCHCLSWFRFHNFCPCDLVSNEREV